MPALRLCFLVLGIFVVLTNAGIPFTALGAAVAALLLLATSLVYTLASQAVSWGTIRLMLAAAVGLFLVAETTSTYLGNPTGFEDEETARVSGTVVRATVRGHTVRLLIDGEADTRMLPALNTRTLLTVLNANASLRWQGARVVAYVTLRRPDPATLPGEFNEQAMCRAQHVSFVGLADIDHVRVIEPPSVLHRLMADVHTSITHALQDHVGEHVAAVLGAVIIGDETALDAEARQAYARSGTAHMFSVSGSHVSIILSLGLLLSIGIQRRWLRATLLIMFIVGYVFLSGGTAPAWRAAVMGLLALWGRESQRDVLGLNILAASILCMLLIDPFLPWAAGFQLSVCATASIIVFAPRWHAHLQRLTLRDHVVKRFLRVSCSVALAAAAGIALPSAIIFGQVAVWSPVANFFVVPLLSAAMVSGSGLIVVHYVAPWLAPSLGWLCTVLVQAADGVVFAFAGLQPLETSDAQLVGQILLAIGLCIWPLLATSWVGLFARQAACVIMLALIMLLPSKHRTATVNVIERRHGMVILIHNPRRTVVLLKLRKRDVGVSNYLKSLHGRIETIDLNAIDHTGVRR